MRSKIYYLCASYLWYKSSRYCCRVDFACVFGGYETSSPRSLSWWRLFQPFICSLRYWILSGHFWRLYSYCSERWMMRFVLGLYLACWDLEFFLLYHGRLYGRSLPDRWLLQYYKRLLLDGLGWFHGYLLPQFNSFLGRYVPAFEPLLFVLRSLDLHLCLHLPVIVHLGRSNLFVLPK